MSLHSFERKSPPLFRRSLSPLARLGVASALSVFFMLADSRLRELQLQGRLSQLDAQLYHLYLEEPQP